jgi:hypothetical protein
MMRRAGQQVKSLPVIYVMSAFSGPAFPGSHFWSGISGLECDQAYRAPIERFLALSLFVERRANRCHSP